MWEDRFSRAERRIKQLEAENAELKKQAILLSGCEHGATRMADGVPPARMPRNTERLWREKITNGVDRHDRCMLQREFQIEELQEKVANIAAFLGRVVTANE